MQEKNITRLLIALLCVLCLISIGACKTTSGGAHIGWGSEPEKCRPERARKGGPPPHAPAHGYRAKYAYRYYPHSYVYFDVHRKVYFYLRGDHWSMSVELPQDIRLQVADYVTIEMDMDKPYLRFKEHKQKYPPGQLKKKKDKWAKKN